MPQETPGQMPNKENWGEVGELGFTTIPEIDRDKPKSPEDPESPELGWSKKINEGYVEDHKHESGEQLPN